MFINAPVQILNVIKRTKSQIYIAPHPLLSPYIAHYTLSFPKQPKSFAHAAEVRKLTLIPDASGCMVYAWNGTQFSESLWGPTTKIVEVTDDPYHPVHRFFIEFHPGGLHALTKFSQHDFSDKQFKIDEIDKPLSSLLSRALFIYQNRISSLPLNSAHIPSNTFYALIINQLIEEVNNILLKKVLDQEYDQHVLIHNITNTIRQTKGNLSIKALAENAYISQRHLNRIFERHIGMTPKQFARLVRINHVINFYQRAASAPASIVAQHLGFFDESHLIRDFKTFCAVTPNQFLKNMSNFYNEPFKY